jgi:hypothetical protein
MPSHAQAAIRAQAATRAKEAASVSALALKKAYNLDKASRGLCKFGERCIHGDNCKFLHEASDSDGVSYTPDEGKGQGKGWIARETCWHWQLKGECQMHANGECTFGHPAEAKGQGKGQSKRFVPHRACDFWKKGFCNNGNACTFAHNEEDKGVDQKICTKRNCDGTNCSYGHPVATTTAMRKSGLINPYPKKSQSESAPQSEPSSPAEDYEKASSVDEYERSFPPLNPTDDDEGYDSDSSYGERVFPESTQLLENHVSVLTGGVKISWESTRPKNITPCVFFNRGTCNKGLECDFKHDPSQKPQQVPHVPREVPPQCSQSVPHVPREVPPRCSQSVHHVPRQVPHLGYQQVPHMPEVMPHLVAHAFDVVNAYYLGMTMAFQQGLQVPTPE